MEKKFDTLFERSVTRFEQGGLLTGDIVKIRKDALKNEKVKNMLNTYKAYLENMINTDLNLRVSAVKSIRPNTTNFHEGGQSSGTDAPYDYFVDIVVEYAPGLWKDPITVPIEILEVVNTGFVSPVPDSLKKKVRSTKPEEVKSPDKDRANATKNTNMKHIAATEDGRDQVKKPEERKAKNLGKLSKESVELEDVYGEMITESKK